MFEIGLHNADTGSVFPSDRYVPIHITVINVCFQETCTCQYLSARTASCQQTYLWLTESRDLFLNSCAEIGSTEQQAMALLTLHQQFTFNVMVCLLYCTYFDLNDRKRCLL